MTHEERKARKQALLADIRGGMPIPQAAAKHALLPATAWTYAYAACIAIPPQPGIKRKPRARKRRARPFTDAQQRANRAAAARLHAQWRKGHILSCAQFPLGKCCKPCHASSAMETASLPNGMHAYVCCRKLRENWKALGFSQDPERWMEWAARKRERNKQ